MLIPVYGFGALGVFTVSQSHITMNKEPIACHLSLMRWLVPKYPCGVLGINCYCYGFDGSASDITSALDDMDEFALAAIAISHCPGVEIPVQIRNFPNLIWFEMYNSTLSLWPQEASLAKMVHHRLSRLFLIHVNMTAFSPRLMSPSFPPTLIDVMFFDRASQIFQRICTSSGQSRFLPSRSNAVVWTTCRVRCPTSPCLSFP